MEGEDVSDGNSLGQQIKATSFECIEGSASQGHMKGAWRNSQSAIDACVKVAGHSLDAIPLHEGETGTIPGIEEDVVYAATLRDRKGLMDHDPEAEGALVKGARRPHVMGGEADVIDRHGLGLGNPGRGDLERLVVWMER